MHTGPRDAEPKNQSYWTCSNHRPPADPRHIEGYIALLAAFGQARYRVERLAAPKPGDLEVRKRIGLARRPHGTTLGFKPA